MVVYVRPPRGVGEGEGSGATVPVVTAVPVIEPVAVMEVVAVGMAVLNYHGYVSIQALEVLEITDLGAVDETTGEYVVIRRLRGTGTFGDPNDICQNVAVALVLGAAFLFDRRLGPLRLLWLAPMGFLGYAMNLTQSRGGLLAAAVATIVVVALLFT